MAAAAAARRKERKRVDIVGASVTVVGVVVEPKALTGGRRGTIKRGKEEGVK